MNDTLLIKQYGELFGSRLYDVHEKNSDTDYLVKELNIDCIIRKLEEHVIKFKYLYDNNYALGYKCIGFKCGDMKIHLVIVPDNEYDACVTATAMFKNLSKDLMKDANFRKKSWVAVKNAIKNYLP